MSDQAKKVCLLFENEGGNFYVRTPLGHLLGRLKLEIVDLDEEPSTVIASPYEIEKYYSDLEKNSLLSSTIAVTSNDNMFNINELMDRRNIRHFIYSIPERPQIRQIAAKAMKLMDIAKNRFTYDVGKSVKIQTTKITTPSEVSTLSEKLIKTLNLGGNFNGTDRILRMLVSETCSNAIFNAPRREDGSGKYNEMNRSTEFTLKDKEVVNFCYFEDTEKFGVYVKDNFGGLNLDTIRVHLHKCVNKISVIDEKKGGYGAGLYMCFNNTDEFIVNIRQDVITEVIFILYREKRMKAFKNRPTSFSFFEM